MDIVNRNPINLWTKTPPFSHGNAPEDIPTITPFLPSSWNANGKSVVVLPGGGYWGLADHEGPGYAEWLAANGYAAFVVKYRLGAHKYHHPAEISDAARAVRFVRSITPQLKLKADKIGIMGSSAGGHLAATASTVHHLGVREEGETDAPNAGRPDFTILCYPVVSLVSEFTHAGSRSNLLGDKVNDPELRKLLSPELNVTKDTPPAFIWHTYEDGGVPVENSFMYASALRKAKIPFELHVYEKGGHGLGLAGGHPWADECLRWLNTL